MSDKTYNTKFKETYIALPRRGAGKTRKDFIKEISEYCGVTYGTAKGWIYRGYPPAEDQRLRVAEYMRQSADDLFAPIF